MAEHSLIYVESEHHYDDAPSLIFVGEAPGAEEEKEGRPFVGKSGKFLRAALEKFINLSSQQYYITNAIKIRPHKNRAPTRQEVVSWCHVLLEEIEKVDPYGKSKIIAVGKIAEEALDVIGLKCHFIYHPAHIMIHRGKYPEWVSQIKGIIHDN